MSDPNTLGSVVRRRRLESGYSLGQLASKVGKTAAEVRAWERDNELPEYGILERLAETLELDLDDIRSRLEAAEGTDEPEPEAEAEGEAEAEVATADDAPVEADASVVTAEEPDDGGFAVEDPFTPPGNEDDGLTETPDEESAPPSDSGPISDPDIDLLEAPTEPVPVPVITETATAARAGRAVAVIEERPPLPLVEAAPDEDPGLLRYLEPLRILFDPDNRYLYWIRAGLTIVVMLIFVVILFSQFGKLLDAIGEVLDSIEPSTTPTDDFDALGQIFS
jgi:transcriptional regulator with XRE-family HTH domain